MLPTVVVQAQQVIQRKDRILPVSGIETDDRINLLLMGIGIRIGSQRLTLLRTVADFHAEPIGVGPEVGRVDGRIHVSGEDPDDDRLGTQAMEDKRWRI